MSNDRPSSNNTKKFSSPANSQRDSVRSRSNNGTTSPILNEGSSRWTEFEYQDSQEPHSNFNSHRASSSKNPYGLENDKGMSNGDLNQDGSLSQTVYLRIRFSTGKDMDLMVNNSDMTIKEVKTQIKAQLEDVPSEQHIRLIHQGRVLTDETKIVDFKSRGKPTRSHLSHSSRNYGTNQDGISYSDIQELFHGSPTAPLILHGQILDEIVETTANPELNRIEPPMGFDRLQEAGFSPEDIQQIRVQFQTMHDIDPNATDPEVIERNRRLEESWIDNATTTLPDGTTEGTYNELLWGLLLGFFLGLLPIFWHQDHAFSRKNQLGILIGLMINILFGGVMLLQ